MLKIFVCGTWEGVEGLSGWKIAGAVSLQMEQLSKIISINRTTQFREDSRQDLLVTMRFFTGLTTKCRNHKVTASYVASNYWFAMKRGVYMGGWMDVIRSVAVCQK